MEGLEEIFPSLTGQMCSLKGTAEPFDGSSGSLAKKALGHCARCEVLKEKACSRVDGQLNAANRMNKFFTDCGNGAVLVDADGPQLVEGDMAHSG